MLETSARLLRLLALLQMRRFWTGRELAERLEITERTLRRDIEKLRSLGYPVDGSAGVAGGYQLGAGASLPPLSLDDDEALAISLGLRTAAASSVAGIEEAALRALMKLERVLPERLRRRADSLRDAITGLSTNGPRVDARLLLTLAKACSDHALVHFTYQKPSGKKPGKSAPECEVRAGEPVGLVQSGSRWYLVAWDTKRDDWRTFRADRIVDVLDTGPRFPPRALPEGGDLRKYVSRSLSLSPYEHQAKVLFFAPVEKISASLPPSIGILEEIDRKSCRLYTGGRTLESLAYWISTIGDDFVIESPPELNAALRDLNARINRSLALSKGFAQEKKKPPGPRRRGPAS